MRLGSFSTTVSDRLNTYKMAVLLWVSTAAFIASALVLLLVSRLGLPLYFTYLAVVLLFGAGVAALSWIGRTMTGPHFFFAEQKSLPSVTGIGGGCDWASGAWLLLLVAGTVEQQLLWAPALMLGLLMMSILFASAFFATGVSTLPGFFAWRYPNSSTDTLTMIVVSVVLLMFALAEFEIASRVLATIGVTPPETVGWIVLALAILPILLGGWLALIFVNVVLTIWLLIAILMPALLLGFAPKLLEANTLATSGALALSPLGPLPQLSSSIGGTGSSVIWVLTLACGFSVLPHVFSRLVLGRTSGATMEHLGWSGLLVFLVLIASGLSVGVVVRGTEDVQNQMLASNHMLHILPYIAVFIAALNALSATLMALCSGIVRGIRRQRKLEPGERSMFGTRFTAVVIAALVGWTFMARDIPVGTIFILAVTVSAGALFVPMFAAVWITNMPNYVSTALVASGTFIGALEIWHGLTGAPVSLFPTPAHAAFTLIILGSIFVVSVKVFNTVSKRPVNDPRAEFLRGA